MSSWEDEDEDFVPQLPTPTPSTTGLKANWDDEEEDLTLKEEVVVPTELSAAQKALIKKKREQEEQTLAIKVKNIQLESETPDQKKLRERKAVEESDTQLAAEMFDNVDNTKETKKTTKSAAGSIASINLANKQDHINFGITVATKLEKSTAFCVTAFTKELLSRTQDKLSVEGIEELHAMLTKLKESRKVAEDAKLREKGKNVSQKANKAKQQKAIDTFGGDYDYADKYDDFANMEDDFM